MLIIYTSKIVFEGYIRPTWTDQIDKSAFDRNI